MMTRTFFLAAGFGLALGLPGAALASDRTDQILRDLRAQGYAQIEVGRTWLGRIHITATGRAGRREIVVNPNTDEILRDLVTPGDRSDASSDDSTDDSTDDSSNDDGNDGGDDGGDDGDGGSDGGEGGSDGGEGGSDGGDGGSDD